MAPAPVKTADTVAMADPCDGGELKEDPCAGGEAKEQVAVADPCDGGELQGGLGVRGTGEGGGGGGTGIGTVGTIGTGSGSGYGAGKRGPRPATSEPKVTLGTHVVIGKLPADVVLRVVRLHLAQVRSCYEKILTTRPGVSGALGLEIVITSNGDVASATATGVAPDLESCVHQRAITWKFPKPEDGIVKVTVSMTFTLPPP